MSTPRPLPAFTSPHPWPPSTIRLTPTPSLYTSFNSLTHQLHILDCRGHDARDMQRTLNYITAELNMRTAEDAALKGKEGDGLIKKMDSGQRMRKMEDQDSRWEKEFGGNPRWGEGRREWNYGK